MRGAISYRCSDAYCDKQSSFWDVTTFVPSSINLSGWPDLSLTLADVFNTRVHVTLTPEDYVPHYTDKFGIKYYLPPIKKSVDTYVLGFNFMNGLYIVIDRSNNMIGVGNITTGKCTGSISVDLTQNTVPPTPVAPFNPYRYTDSALSNYGSSTLIFTIVLSCLVILISQY